MLLNGDTACQTALAHDRIHKVARTLADLAASPNIRPQDILEAIQFRRSFQIMPAETSGRPLRRVGRKS